MNATLTPVKMEALATTQWAPTLASALQGSLEQTVKWTSMNATLLLAKMGALVITQWAPTNACALQDLPAPTVK